MPPLRFKAVCTETGREFGPFGLYAQRFPNHDGIDFIEGHHSIVSIGASKIDSPSVDLCQSTGLTDSRGQEVYEGDVLTTPSGSVLFSIEFFIDQFLGQNLDNKILSDLSDIELLTVVGNRWMPQAELKARAEAVSNG